MIRSMIAVMNMSNPPSEDDDNQGHDGNASQSQWWIMQAWMMKMLTLSQSWDPEQEENHRIADNIFGILVMGGTQLGQNCFCRAVLQGLPSRGCKFSGRKGSFCPWTKGPENRRHEVKLHPLSAAPWSALWFWVLFAWWSDVVYHLQSDTVLSCKCCATWSSLGKTRGVVSLWRYGVCVSVLCQGASGCHSSPGPPPTLFTPIKSTLTSWCRPIRT